MTDDITLRQHGREWTPVRVIAELTTVAREARALGDHRAARRAAKLIRQHIEAAPGSAYADLLGDEANENSPMEGV